MKKTWTAADVLDLPVVIDLVTAGSVLDMSRTVAYETQRRGEFPVPVIRVGARYRVATADLRRVLGLDTSAWRSA